MPIVIIRRIRRDLHHDDITAWRAASKNTDFLISLVDHVYWK